MANTYLISIIELDFDKTNSFFIATDIQIQSLVEEKKLEEFVEKTDAEYPSKFCIIHQSLLLLIIIYHSKDLSILTHKRSLTQC